MDDLITIGKDNVTVPDSTKFVTNEGDNGIYTVVPNGTDIYIMNEYLYKLLLWTRTIIAKDPRDKKYY